MVIVMKEVSASSRELDVDMYTTVSNKVSGK